MFDIQKKKKGASYQFATTEQPNFYLDPWPKLYCKSLNGKQWSNRQKGKGIQESASTGNTGLRSCNRNGIYLVGNMRNFNHYISQSNSGDNWKLKRPNTSYAQPNEYYAFQVTWAESLSRNTTLGNSMILR